MARVPFEGREAARVEAMHPAFGLLIAAANDPGGLTGCATLAHACNQPIALVQLGRQPLVRQLRIEEVALVLRQRPQPQPRSPPVAAPGTRLAVDILSSPRLTCYGTSTTTLSVARNGRMCP